MLISNVSYYDFINMFHDLGRDDQFSRDGLGLLYEYLSDLSDEIGENIIIDVIAICCEYTEYNIVDYYEENQDEINETFMAESYNDLSPDEIIEYATLNDEIVAYDDNIIILYS